MYIVYIKFFDGDFNIVSFESKVNETTMGFQWEPSDPIPVDDGNVICIWSSSSMNDMGYNIIGKMITHFLSHRHCSSYFKNFFQVFFHRLEVLLPPHIFVF